MPRGVLVRTGGADRLVLPLPVAAIDPLMELLWWLWQTNMPKVEAVRVRGF